MDLNLWRAAKKEQHLTIAEIAERACLPKGTVQNIFCGYVPNPRTDTVEAIERALGLNEKSPTVRDAQSDGILLPSRYNSLATTILESDLSKNEISSVIAFIKFLKSANR